jgi:ribulose-phosphate 3-epimerase
MDVMDGKFVNNYCLGTDFIRQVKKKSSIPLDIHLMVEQPERVLDWFAFGEGDYVSVHVESTNHLQRSLEQIHARGAKVMAALNPATPICVLEDIICDVDLVLLMSVNPGFGGQKFIPHTFEKVRALREMIDRRGSKALIQVDGGVGLDNWQQLRQAGADVLVAGSAVYGAEDPMAVCEIMSK